MREEGLLGALLCGVRVREGAAALELMWPCDQLVNFQGKKEIYILVKSGVIFFFLNMLSIK